MRTHASKLAVWKNKKTQWPLSYSYFFIRAVTFKACGECLNCSVPFLHDKLCACVFASRKYIALIMRVLKEIISHKVKSWCLLLTQTTDWLWQLVLFYTKSCQLLPHCINHYATSTPRAKYCINSLGRSLQVHLAHCTLPWMREICAHQKCYRSSCALWCPTWDIL